MGFDFNSIHYDKVMNREIVEKANAELQINEFFGSFGQIQKQGLDFIFEGIKFSKGVGIGQGADYVMKVYGFSDIVLGYKSNDNGTNYITLLYVRTKKHGHSGRYFITSNIKCYPYLDENQLNEILIKKSLEVYFTSNFKIDFNDLIQNAGKAQREYQERLENFIDNMSKDIQVLEINSVITDFYFSNK